MPLLCIVLLGLLAAGAWELRAIRKVKTARWDYDRFVKLMGNKIERIHENDRTPTPSAYQVIRDCEDKYLLMPSELPYKIQKQLTEDKFELVANHLVPHFPNGESGDKLRPFASGKHS